MFSVDYIHKSQDAQSWNLVNVILFIFSLLYINKIIITIPYKRNRIKPFFPTTSRSSENILLRRIDELLQPKEKMTTLSLMGISLLEFCSSQR